MNVLALDTSLEELGLALRHDAAPGDAARRRPAARPQGASRLRSATGPRGAAQLRGATQLRTVTIRAGLQHGQTLLPWVDRLLAEAGIRPRELDLLVCSVGPGSFTGLRIGLAAARGLARGAGCPVVGVSTLDALAWRHRGHPGLVVPVVDARKGRSYAAVYAGQTRISDYLDLTLEALAALVAEAALRQAAPCLLITGPQAAALEPFLKRAHLSAEAAFDRPALQADPAALLELGETRFREKREQTLRPSPLYLRRSEAEIKRYGE